MSKPPKKNKGRKPTVDELVAARNPLQRLAVRPLDPYQVRPPEGDGARAAPLPETQISTGEETQSREAGGAGAATPPEPATTATRTPDTPTEGAGRADAELAENVVVPYSTHIRRSLIRSIKLRAFTTDRKDREIVEAALEEYFENHPVKPVS